ncbi:MAG TPA: hypothetical protein VFL41_09110 [Gaiellaceae bacterium]|nr:hypothetical protein [Gaiellaceae bacterium]HET8653150.1 hypothetical protein [Gaiellaceae bacterium]
MASTIKTVSGALVAAAVLLAASASSAATPLATPAPLAPVSGASAQALPAFSWTPVAGAAKYEFQFAADSGFNAPVLGRGEDQFFTRNARATLKKTIPNGTYYWRVRAVSADGSVSPWSAPRQLLKAWTLAPALQAPAHGAVVSHPTSPLVLRWAAVPHAAKYLVTIASDPQLGSAVGGQQNVETSGTVYAPRALLLPPGTYYWGVTPMDAQDHRGVPSPVQSFTWTWPTATTAGVSDLMTETEVFDPFFSWTPVPGAAKYELEVNPTADFSPGSKVCCTGTIIGGSHSPTSMLRDNTYYWRVRALDAFGNAGQWNLGTPFTKTFDKVPPVAAPSIKNLRLRDNLSDPGSDLDPSTAGYQTSVPILSWSPVPGASSYEVDVFPFEGGICDWSDMDGTDHWRVTTATTAWTMLGAGFQGVQPYEDPHSVATDLNHAPLAGKRYCARVRARADRASGNQEVYGDYTYLTDSTGTSFQWRGPADGEPCAPTCSHGNLGSDDYLLPATGVSTTRMPLFTWRPMPRRPWKSLLNGNGAKALTLRGVPPLPEGLTEWTISVANDLGSSAFDVLTFDDPGKPPDQDPTFTYADGDITGLAAAIEGDASVPFDVQVHQSGVGLAYLSDAPFVPGRRAYFVLVSKDPSFSNLVDYAFTQHPAYAPRTGTASTTYSDEETLYYWAVLPASGTNGDNAAGDPLLAAPDSFQKLSTPPSQLKPAAGADVTGQPTFQWSSAEGSRRYRLQVSNDPSFGTLLDDVLTASTAYTSATSYPADTVLYWRVRADDENLVGLRWSAVGTFQRRLPVPSPRFDSPAGDMYPLMSWTPVQGAVSYRLAVDEPDGDHAEYDDFRSAAASFSKMTGTGVAGIRVRANFATKSGQTTPGPWSGTVNFTRTMGEPTGASTDASPTSLLFSWDPKPGTKQYRVLVANREDFATTIEDVKTDNTSYAPTLTSTVYMNGGTFWWKVAAYDEDNNVGDFTRAHSFTLQRTTAAGGIRVSQRLRIYVKGRLRANRMSRVVVTVKAGGNVIPGAKVRGLALGLRPRWRATNRRGQVVFRFRPKRKGVVFFQATKRNYLVGTARVRVR